MYIAIKRKLMSIAKASVSQVKKANIMKCQSISIQLQNVIPLKFSPLVRRIKGTYKKKKC